MKPLGIIFAAILLISCGKEDPDPSPSTSLSYRGLDASLVPHIEGRGVQYKNGDGQNEDFLQIISAAGMNTVRLRLWYDPIDSRSSWDEVLAFSNQIKSEGLKLWLTVHYSDTWADPAHQNPPAAWEGLSIEEMEDSVFNYTARIAQEMQPDIIQIGNEVNNGFLHPLGHRWNSPEGFHRLFESGSAAVRSVDPDIKVMLQFAGYRGLESMLLETDSLDYDMVGLSYYPMWHGKSLDSLSLALASISEEHERTSLLAEFSYPFTLDWADWTNNIVGLESQLLPDYPATPSGQERYVQDLVALLKSTESVGICYWGGEYIAFDGPQSTEGSPYENQALFDFNFAAQPALEVFD
ncbi:glycosyl hydrolase 53 family protein [Cryomorphaceae bacterium]|nr:glycosyl hydrolase 53 family protein [Cryomorphaceae bacterium]